MPKRKGLPSSDTELHFLKVMLIIIGKALPVAAKIAASSKWNWIKLICLTFISKVKEKFITVALYSQISLKPPVKGRERTIQDFPPGLPGTIGGVFHHPGTLRNS